MTIHETPVGHPEDEQDGREHDLELLTDDGTEWTVVPADATGEAQLTRWITVEADLLRELEAWR